MVSLSCVVKVWDNFRLCVGQRERKSQIDGGQTSTCCCSFSNCCCFSWRTWSCCSADTMACDSDCRATWAAELRAVDASPTVPAGTLLTAGVTPKVLTDIRVQLQSGPYTVNTVQEKWWLPVNMLASSRSTRVPSLVEIQVKCKGSTSRSPVSAVKLPSAAAQLLTFPFPASQNTPVNRGALSSHSFLQTKRWKV